jgi:hypothetical protein
MILLEKVQLLWVLQRAVVLMLEECYHIIRLVQ